MSGIPRITFGIIVLNGEPFTKYCLRALYPYAYEIIVVEGGSKNAQFLAPGGQSKDGTLMSLYEFKEQEDIEDKIKIITKDGLWEEKDEQSQAYADMTTGDYLWQIDIDEFYTEDNMKKIIELLKEDPEITALSFKTITFWGDLETAVDSSALKRGRDIFHRLFKWKMGYKYVKHRPPTVCDENGIDLRDAKYFDGNLLYKKYGIFMSHYAFLFPSQVIDKAKYYANYSLRVDSLKWAQDNFLMLKDPFRVHIVYESPSWLKRCYVNHNEHIIDMFNNIKPRDPSFFRNMDDVDALLSQPLYKLKRFIIEYGDYLKRYARKLKKSVICILVFLFHIIVPNKALREKIKGVVRKYIFKPIPQNGRGEKVFLRNMKGDL